MEQKEITLIPGHKIKEYKEESKQHLILAYSKDYLSIDEFEERINTIEQSKSIEEIKKTTRDLPLDELVEKSIDQQSLFPYKVNIMGDKHVDGSLAVTEYGGVKSILGSTTIDLRTIEAKDNYINLKIPTYLSEVKIIVPRDMKVINKLDDFLSEVKIHLSVNSSETEKKHIVQVSGKVILSSVKIVTG